MFVIVVANGDKFLQITKSAVEVSPVLKALAIGSFEDLRCQAVANMVKGKTVEGIKKEFGLGDRPGGYQGDEWTEDK
ncbi:hypothetical protein BG015_003591 [Linnemannia schmuckeri]|uniref:SKP1 component dimerisation domain-containing protein n=1 Tax=Linnemannia schmuckeri TaxID=64567 RepID=A0A9P5S2B8_9FUNG|nr:hypothetical protein BG015_003591 [Linnemannia schmuckeri]